MDIHDVNISNNEFVSISTNNHSHEEQDYCSPLCVCSCCGQYFVTTPLPKWSTLLPLISQFEEKSVFFFYQNWKNDCHESIFRPPQIS